MKVNLNTTSNSCIPIFWTTQISSIMKKLLIVLVMLISQTLFAQGKNNQVILGLGIDSRLSYRIITGYDLIVTPYTPRVLEGMQLHGNALSLSLMVSNSRFRLMYGLEYAIRYGHIYYKTAYPDTTYPWYHAVQDPVNGFITDYILLAKKELVNKKLSLWVEAGFGYMNRGTHYYYTTIDQPAIPGLQIIRTHYRNSSFNSYVVGVSMRKEWLYLSLRGHIVPANKHNYDRFRAFWIPNLVFNYQIPLSLKEKTDE